MSSLIEAKSIVLEVLDLAKLPEEEYSRVWRLLINVYRDMNLNHISNVKMSKQAMDSNHIVYYPDDMLELVKIYVPYRGRLEPLTETNIVPTVSLRMGRLENNLEDGEGEAIAVETRGMMAKPHNMMGYYYNYKYERYIKFLVESRTEVLLAYKTSGLSTDDTLIPAECKNAIIWNVIYEDTLLSKNPQWKTGEVRLKAENELVKLRRVSFDYDAFITAWIKPLTPTR